MTHECNVHNDELYDEFLALANLGADDVNLEGLGDQLRTEEMESLLKSIVVDEVDELEGTGWDAEDLFPPEPWFSLKIHDEGKGKRDESAGDAAEEPRAVRKSWSEFERFHNLLITDEFGCLPAVRDAIVPLPILEDESSPDRDEKLAEALSSYFHSILQIPEVQNSSLLSGFLDERSFLGWRFDNWENGCDEGGGHEVEHKSTTLLPITAVDFLLQPLEPQKLYIRPRMEYNRDMVVLKGESVVWKFAVQELDIDFLVYLYPDVDGRYLETLEKEDASDVVDSNFREKACEKFQVLADSNSNAGVFTVHNTTRYSAMSNYIQGSFTANQNGFIRLKWNNKFSRLRGKKLLQLVRVVGSKEMRSAIEAADAVAKKAQGGLRRNSSAGKISGAAAPHTVSLHEGVSIHVTPVTEQDVFIHPLSSLLHNSSSTGGSKDENDNNTMAYLMNGGSLSSTPDKVQAESNEKLRSSSISSFYRTLYSTAQAAGYALVNSSVGTTDNAADDSAGTTSLPANVANNSTTNNAADDSAGTTSLPANVANNSTTDNAADDSAGTTSLPANVANNSTTNLLSDEVTLPRSSIAELLDSQNRLEDELAVTEVKRTQAETCVRFVLSRLLKKDAEVEQLYEELESMKEGHLVTEQLGERTTLERDELTQLLKQSIQDKDKLDDALLKEEREKDMLRAERNVWQMARSGIQAELSKVVGELELEKQSHDDTRRLLARAQEALHREELENHQMAAKLKEQADKYELEKAQEETYISGQEAEDLKSTLVELEREVAKLHAQKSSLVCELKKQMKLYQDKLSAINAEAEEARMMQRTMKSRLKALQEECDAHIGNEAENEIKIYRLRAEKKLLVSELRRGSAPCVELPPLHSSPTTSVEDVHAAPVSMLSRNNTNLDPQVMISQLSKQIVYLRKRKMELKEQLDNAQQGGIGGDNVTSLLSRQVEDIDRAVMHLQLRVKRLMNTEQGGGCDDEGSNVSTTPISKHQPPA